MRPRKGSVKVTLCTLFWTMLRGSAMKGKGGARPTKVRMRESEGERGRERERESSEKKSGRGGDGKVKVEERGKSPEKMFQESLIEQEERRRQRWGRPSIFPESDVCPPPDITVHTQRNLT